MIAAVLTLTYRWAFRTLPHEEWQIICCFPRRKSSNGYWQGWNLTWYGFFNAAAVIFAFSIFIILPGTMSLPVIYITFILILFFLICLKASVIIAWLIENKPNTATVGGASFMGIIIAPGVFYCAKLAGNRYFNMDFPVIPVLSAMAIAYAFGEGIGRLGCISFGCCYGKPLKECSSRIQNIFRRYNFVFTGKTKKIAYAHSLDGQKIIPVQAMTTIIYSITGFIGSYLFLKGFTATAFLLTIIITQVWRFFSEFLRADYRGGGKISAYQIMALISPLYSILIVYVFHEGLPGKPDLMTGLLKLWNPFIILSLIALWAFTFYYTGKSKVTAALVNIHVLKDKI